MHFGPTLEYWYAGTFLLLAVLQYQAAWRQKAREARAGLANLLKRGVRLVLRMAWRSITGAPGMAARITLWIGRGAKRLVLRPKALAESPATHAEVQAATVTGEAAVAVEPAAAATVSEIAAGPLATEEVPAADPTVIEIAVGPQITEEVPAVALADETVAQAEEVSVAPTSSGITEPAAVATVIEIAVGPQTAEEVPAVALADEAVAQVAEVLVAVAPVDIAEPVIDTIVETPVQSVVLSAQNDNGVETAIAVPDTAEQTEKVEVAAVAGQADIMAEAVVPPAARKAWLPRISLRARLSALVAPLLRRTRASTGTVTTPDGAPTIDPATTAENVHVATVADAAAPVAEDPAASTLAATAPVTAEPILVPAASSVESASPAYVLFSGVALDQLPPAAQTSEDDANRLAKRIDKVIGFRAAPGDAVAPEPPRFDGVLFKAGENLLKWLPGNSNIDLWHILVCQMEFETAEEFKIAAWIVDRPLCDRATAALVLAQIAAEDCMHYSSAEECSGLDRYRWQIARTICERSEMGRYFFCDFNLNHPEQNINLGKTLRTLRRRANELLQEGKTLPWPVPTELLSSTFDGRDAVCDEYHVDGMTLWLPSRKAAA